MTAHPCAGCGMSKQADIHSRHNPDGHVFVDPRPSQQQKQRDAERERELRWRPARERQVAEFPDCEMAGAETGQPCGPNPLTGVEREVDHRLPRARGGRTDGSTPLTTCCGAHHYWITFKAEGIAWAREHEKDEAGAWRLR